MVVRRVLTRCHDLCVDRRGAAHERRDRRGSGRALSADQLDAGAGHAAARNSGRCVRRDRDGDVAGSNQRHASAAEFGREFQSAQRHNGLIADSMALSEGTRSRRQLETASRTAELPLTAMRRPTVQSDVGSARPPSGPSPPSGPPPPGHQADRPPRHVRPRLAPRAAPEPYDVPTSITRRNGTQAHPDRRRGRPRGGAVGGQRCLHRLVLHWADTGADQPTPEPTGRREAGRLEADHECARCARGGGDHPGRRHHLDFRRARRRQPNHRTARGLRPRHRQLEGRRRPSRSGAARDGGDLAG